MNNKGKAGHPHLLPNSLAAIDMSKRAVRGRLDYGAKVQLVETDVDTAEVRSLVRVR